MVKGKKEDCKGKPFDFHENVGTAKVEGQEMAVCKDCGDYINPADFEQKETKVAEPEKPEKPKKPEKLREVPKKTAKKADSAEEKLFEIEVDGLISVPGVEDGFFPLMGVKKGDLVKVFRK